MTQRKFIVALLAVVAMVTMACGDDGDTDVAVDDDPTTTAQTDRGAAGDTADDTTELTADLSALNDSGASGTATVRFEDGKLHVEVKADGVSAGVPHAQHIHIGGRNECPDETLSGDDEFLTTAEGAPAYGGVKVSLTTDGDTGAESALAVKRFPVAEDGSYTYSRTFDLPSGVTESEIEDGVIVVHGITDLFGDDASFDGDMKSSLDPSLPLEATIPAACGKLS